MLSAPRFRWSAFLTVVALALACVVTGCGSGRGGAAAGVTIEALTPTPAVSALIGGKPASMSHVPVTSATDAPAADPPEIVAAADATPVAPTATPAPRASDGSVAPAEGRWIDVNVSSFVVRLMDGTRVMREIAPVAVGAEVDTGAYASTQTGLFHVNNKIEDLAYDPPYDTYISHWVGYDLDKANGFHSFLKDKDGKVVDAATGRVSNGCVRTGAPEAVFAFAEVGMPVWVHG